MKIMKILLTGGSGFIGTNFVGMYRCFYDIVNLDLRPPPVEAYRKHWVDCDILDRRRLVDVFCAERPNAVVHLAARTDTDGVTLDDYVANTDGTRNIIFAVKAAPGIQRLMVTSTQFVNQTSFPPANDQDFAPDTVYGQSKVITERLVRAARLPCPWVIIRPTNVWGPYHFRYQTEFWNVLRKGYYLHPASRQPVIRSYGYVENVCWQIKRLLEVPMGDFHGQVYYVGDRPIDLREYVDLWSRKLTGRPARNVPREFLAVVAAFGTTLKFVGIRFPLTLSRLQSMTTCNPAPMEKSFNKLGDPPYSLDIGIDRTIAWLKAQPDFGV